MIIGRAENWLSFKSSGNATATVVVFHHQSSRLAIYPHLTAPKMRDVGRPRCLSLGHDISEDGIGFLQALKEAPCRLTDLLRRLFNYIAYKGYCSDAMPCSSGLRRIHLGSRHDFVMLRGPFWDHPFSYGSWMMLDFDMFISRWTAQLSTDATFLPGTCSGQHEAWHPEPGSLGDGGGKLEPTTSSQINATQPSFPVHSKHGFWINPLGLLTWGYHRVSQAVAWCESKGFNSLQEVIEVLPRCDTMYSRVQLGLLLNAG